MSDNWGEPDHYNPDRWDMPIRIGRKSNKGKAVVPPPSGPIRVIDVEVRTRCTGCGKTVKYGAVGVVIEAKDGTASLYCPSCAFVVVAATP